MCTAKVLTLTFFFFTTTSPHQSQNSWCPRQNIHFDSSKQVAKNFSQLTVISNMSTNCVIHSPANNDGPKPMVTFEGRWKACFKHKTIVLLMRDFYSGQWVKLSNSSGASGAEGGANQRSEFWGQAVQNAHLDSPSVVYLAYSGK